MTGSADTLLLADETLGREFRTHLAGSAALIDWNSSSFLARIESC